MQCNTGPVSLLLLIRVLIVGGNARKLLTRKNQQLAKLESPHEIWRMNNLTLQLALLPRDKDGGRVQKLVLP